jgi:hypothetical protein
MAWTAPRTWVTGEVVTAAIMNTHVRDNLNAMESHLIVRKTSDQSVTSSTALVNDTALSMAVAASEVWLLDWTILYTASSTGDLKTAWTFPGGELRMVLTGYDTASVPGIWATGVTASPTSNFAFGGATTLTPPVFVRMYYTNGGSPGTLQLQWAQNVSDATATIVKTNSCLWGVKIA